jgi:hypothetical protein
MSRKLFGRIVEGVCFHGTYFQCKPNAIGKIVFSSYQKCSAAIRMLASEVAGDLVDEYMLMNAKFYEKSTFFMSCVKRQIISRAKLFNRRILSS